MNPGARLPVPPSLVGRQSSLVHGRRSEFEPGSSSGFEELWENDGSALFLILWSCAFHALASLLESFQLVISLDCHPAEMAGQHPPRPLSSGVSFILSLSKNFVSLRLYNRKVLNHKLITQEISQTVDNYVEYVYKRHSL